MLRSQVVPRGDLERNLSFTASPSESKKTFISGLRNVVFRRIAVKVSDKNAEIQFSTGGDQTPRKVSPYQLYKRGYSSDALGRVWDYPYLLRYDSVSGVFISAVVEFYFPAGQFANDPKLDIIPSSTAAVIYSWEYDLVEEIDDTKYTEDKSRPTSVLSQTATPMLPIPPRRRNREEDDLNVP